MAITIPSENFKIEPTSNEANITRQGTIIEHRHKTGYVRVHTRYGMFELIDDLLGIRVQKAMGSAAGAFTIYLRWKPSAFAIQSMAANSALSNANWIDIIHDFSVVEIGMAEWQWNSAGGKTVNPDTIKYRMVGFVRHRGEARRMANIPANSLEISGSDMGGLFLIQQIIYDPYIADTHAILGGIANNLTYSGSPDAVIRQLIDKLLFDPTKRHSITFKLETEALSDPNYWLNTTDKIMSVTLKNTLVTDLGVLQATGPLWNAIQSFAESPFFELFVETDTKLGICYLIFRPAPFTPDMWVVGTMTGRVIDIPDEDTKEINTSISESEALNYFWCYPTANPIPNKDMKSFIQPIMIDYFFVTNTTQQKPYYFEQLIRFGSEANRTFEDLCKQFGYTTPEEIQSVALKNIDGVTKRKNMTINLQTNPLQLNAIQKGKLPQISNTGVNTKTTWYDVPDDYEVRISQNPKGIAITPLNPQNYSHMYAPMEEYGVRIKEVESKFVRLFENGKSSTDKNAQDAAVNQAALTIAQLSLTLTMFYAMNHTFRSGTIRIKGNEDIKIGKYLRVYDRKKSAYYRYYIESWSDEWEFNNPDYRTTIGVTRGVPEKIWDGQTYTNYYSIQNKIMLDVKSALEKNKRLGDVDKIQPLGSELSPDDMIACFDY